MIYIHLSRHLHTLEPSTDFNFTFILKGFNAVFIKSLLVSIITIKKRKLLPQSFISEMS